MNPAIENITNWFSKMETMGQEVKKLSDRIQYLENQQKISNSIPIEKPNLLTINDVLKEYRISRTSFYFIRKKEKISPKGYKGKILLYDRNDIEKSVIKKVS